ncbi:hypothetical protein BDV18DRAFT_134930 [Aspergillus unguis]
MRRLPVSPSAALARLPPTCSSVMLASRLQSQPALRPFNQIPALRPFSYTSSVYNANANSPFRLSSTPSPPQPPLESASDSHADPESDIPGRKDYSPYPPRRQWPPDMSKLSPKHQFRLERKYRRRAALKYARPKWTKATKLVQWGLIGFVVVYALLFMQWDERGGNPLEEFRTYIFGSLKGAFSAPPSPSSMRRPEEPAQK